MKKAEIITAAIAIYSAVLWTIAIVRQVLSDRAKIRSRSIENMQMVGHPRYAGMTLTIVRVTNVGRQCVTITTFGAIRLHPNTNFVAVDSQPQMPSEITEGKYIERYWDQSDLDFSTIDYWAAWDSHGRVYKGGRHHDSNTGNRSVSRSVNRGRRKKNQQEPERNANQNMGRS
jgi:hypothetical protein